MLIKTLPLGQMETNCYIVTDEKTLACAVVDPGDESNVVLDYIEDNKLKLEHIFLTHGHFDHTGAVIAIAEETGADVWINSADLDESGRDVHYRFYPQGMTVKNYKGGDNIVCGDLNFEVISTPGHTKGSVTLRCGNALFTGDTLFRDSCGRTDLPGGDMGEMLASLRKLSAIEGDLEVYPGHMDSSNLDRERKFNYYMKYAVGQK